MRNPDIAVLAAPPGHRHTRTAIHAADRVSSRRCHLPARAGVRELRRGGPRHQRTGQGANDGQRHAEAQGPAERPIGVATEGFRALRQQLMSAWEEGGRGREAFEAMGVVYVRFAVANPAHYRVMFGCFVDPQACDPELAAEAAGAFHALVDALSSLQRDALVRGEDIVTMARFVWAVVHGVAMLGIDGRLREPGGVEVLTQYALERLRTGIAPEPIAGGEAPRPGERGRPRATGSPAPSAIRRQS